MNQMVFEKYLQDSNEELIPHALVLPPEAPKVEIPEKGMLKLEKDTGALERIILSPTEVYTE